MRAIAVVAVIVYHSDLSHTHVSWMQGGFLGVEVFFVISGYLITLLLIGERERTGAISLKNFWLRRFRRLVPAAFLMMAVVVVYSSFAGYLKDSLGKLKFATFWGILYASNWYQLLIGQSYGEDQGRPPLLRHMWSLAVEEQFYLIWPLVMVFVMARYRNRMPKVAAACLATGIGLSVIAAIMYAAGVDWNWMYLGTQSRASGILLGAAMAIMWRPYAVARSPLRNRGRLVSLVGVVGLVVLIVAFANFRLTVQTDDGEVGWKWLWYGGILLVDVATLCMIAAATHFRSFFGQKVLGLPPLVWIGMRSYGLYLWHWPIFMLVRPGAVDDGGDVDWQFWRVMLLRVFLMVLATELSFRYVEMPIRQGKFSAWAKSLFRPAPNPDAARRRRGLLAAGLLAVGLTFVGGYRVATASNTQSVADLNQQAGEGATCDVLSDPSCLPTATTSVATGSTTVATTDPTASTSATVTTSATTRPGQAVTPVTATTRPAATTAPPTTKPPAPIAYYAIGDSVMLGAAQQLSSRGIVTDAKQSRQLKDGVAIVSFLNQQHLLGKALIVHLGTNGTLSDSRVAELMSYAKHVPLVLFLTVRVPTKPWQDSNNAIIRALPSKYPNVKVLDWQNLSATQPDVFYEDGIHLKQHGRELYAALVAQAVGLK
jgi:peptidoglycan/LPS O-acetylase OafA/YrhL